MPLFIAAAAAADADIIFSGHTRDMMSYAALPPYAARQRAATRRRRFR